MNYLHHPYAFAGHAAVPMEQPMAFDPAMTHPSMIHPMDGYMYAHPPPFDMMDFYHQPIMDYEEYAENLSRPRLTKEQVETLEAQFQAHPKPSSNVKRQLAAQTNLSLPRVANWFQNRRAKAKQQRRQEEFERMQKAKAEAEEAARARSTSADQPADSKENSKTPAAEADKTATPKKEDSNKTASSGEPNMTPPSSSAAAAPSVSRSKHQKTKSQSIREATFASLQRALSAAAAARETYHGDDGDSQPITDDLKESVSPTTVSNSVQEPQQQQQQQQHNSQGISSSWASSQGSQEQYSSQCQESHNGVYQGVPFHSQGEEWMGQVQTSSEPPASQDAGSAYNSMQYPLQAGASLTRSSSNEVSNNLQGIGIYTTTPPTRQMSLLTHQADKTPWKEAGKELDLAARRKRPRPAAIGTSKSSSMLSASASVSPNARMTSYGGAAGQGVRQSKSAQSLNSRYAGVRKASQRSPLNYSTFSESGLHSSKADMSSMLQSTVTTNALAPPTPLTPEDMHHLLPTSPSDGYCLSAQPSSQFFPTTQSMQIHVASPPATPLTVDMMSSYPYQHGAASAAPPMSAPAHYATFPEFTAPCEPAPLTARSWGEAPTIPSPIAIPENHLSGRWDPAEISPVSYEPTAEGKTSTISPPMIALTADGKFMSQEVHGFVAPQQLPSDSKQYNFTNHTPNDF